MCLFTYIYCVLRLFKVCLWIHVSRILSWIICVEFAISFNIHHAFGVFLFFFGFESTWVSLHRLILKVGLTKSQVRTLYQDCALTSVTSQNDWKVPRKLIHVTNILISTENQISKSVYWWFWFWFVTPVAGSIFRPLFPDSYFYKWVQERLYLQNLLCFSSNPSNLVGKVFLCERRWPQLQLRNEGTPPDFETFFLEKRPWKSFSTNVLIRGEMNPLHKLEHKITSVGYQSSKAELEISFIKTRLEMWVWERGIDPASGFRLSVTVRREMVRGTTCECKCEKVSQDTVWRGCHAGPLQETRVREPLFKVYDEYKPQFLFPNIVVYSFVPSWCRWPAQYHCPCLNSFNYIHCLDLWNILGSGAELNG